MREIVFFCVPVISVRCDDCIGISLLYFGDIDIMAQNGLIK